MARIEGGVVTTINNLPNDIEIIYGTTNHREYVPKFGGVRIKRKGNIVYLLLDSDTYAAEGAAVIKLDYTKITSPVFASAAALVTTLLEYIEAGASGESVIEDNVYIGKLHDHNGDFDVSYFNATTIRFDTLPQRIDALRTDDIEYVRQINSAGKVVAQYDRDDAIMTITGNRLSITGASFANTDSFLVVTNIHKHVVEPDTEFMDSYIGGPANANYDFVATYHNYHMLDFSGFPDNITSFPAENIVLIKVLDDDNNVYLNITPEEYSIKTTGAGLQIDGNDITDVIFLPTDRFLIYTNIHKKTVGRYNNVQTLVTNSLVGINDDVWRDQGSEIDCRGYKNLSLWVVFQPNDSVGNELKVLSKHTAADADEYRLDTYASYIKVLGEVNIKVKLDFVLDNSTPFVQVLTRFVGEAGTTSTTSSTTSTTSSTTTTSEGVTRGRIWIKYTLGY